MSKKLEFEKVQAGVEDLLLDANLPDAVSQNRLVGTVLTGVTVHKVNLRTIPYSGKYGDGNFVSIGDKLDEIAGNKDKYIAETANGGIGIVSGASDVTWDGGALGSNQVGLVQKLGNGNVRWLGYADIGSDTWHWRGTVRGVAGTAGNEYVIKSQLDTLATLVNTQSDWNQSNTNSPAYIKNKPAITTYSQATTSTAGIVEKATDVEANTGDDDVRYITPKQLKDIAAANAGGGSSAVVYRGKDNMYTLSNISLPHSKENMAQTSSADISFVIIVPAGTYTLHADNAGGGVNEATALDTLYIYKKGTVVATSTHSSPWHFPPDLSITVTEDTEIGCRWNMDSGSSSSSVGGNRITLTKV